MQSEKSFLSDPFPPTHPQPDSDSDSDPDPDHDPVYIKLADFGMAGFIGRDGRLKGRCGTPGYVAPDILKAGLNESYS